MIFHDGMIPKLPGKYQPTKNQHLSAKQQTSPICRKSFPFAKLVWPVPFFEPLRLCVRAFVFSALPIRIAPMHYRRMPIEVESPGAAWLQHDSLQPRRKLDHPTPVFGDLGLHLDDLVLAYSDHFGKTGTARPADRRIVPPSSPITSC